MPDKDGLAVLEEVNFDQLPTKAIVVTMADDGRDIVRAVRLGARGIMAKQSTSDLLIKSIGRAYGGEIWLDNRMTAEVFGSIQEIRGSRAETGQATAERSGDGNRAIGSARVPEPRNWGETLYQ
jgi:DNA-binding NarL/FixJ family response regulator